MDEYKAKTVNIALNTMLPGSTTSSFRRSHILALIIEHFVG